MALQAKAENAETLLLQGCFSEAFASAEALLLQCRNGGLDGTATSTRAAFVLVQALYELGRFGEALPQLHSFYGHIHNMPCNVLVLW